MDDYRVLFADGTFAYVMAWDKSDAYEVAQDIYGKSIIYIR